MLFMERKTYSTEIVGGSFTLTPTETAGVYDYEMSNPCSIDEGCKVELSYGVVDVIDRTHARYISTCEGIF